MLTANTFRNKATPFNGNTLQNDIAVPLIKVEFECVHMRYLCKVFGKAICKSCPFNKGNMRSTSTARESI